MTLPSHRAVDLEVVRILRDRVKECQRREEVNHLQRCREHVEAYMKAFLKYRSEGNQGRNETVLSFVFCYYLGWLGFH